MIEKDFNKLDDDFITLWSRFFLTYNYDEIKIDIERLAENGQINAIAMYYGFLDVYEEENLTIKNKLVKSSFYEYNFNESYANAFRSEWLYKKERQGNMQARAYALKAFADSRKIAEQTYDPLVCNRVLDCVYAFNCMFDSSTKAQFKELEKYSRDALKQACAEDPSPQNLYTYAKNLFCPQYLKRKKGLAIKIFEYLSKRNLSIDDVSAESKQTNIINR